jgi:hypothetical protein
MAVATASEEVVEARRRSLLAESDVLLEDVEDLRLSEEAEAPLRLLEAIRALQIRLGRRNPPLSPANWIELVDSTVERAWDRWCYAQQHAVRAARERFRAQVAVAVASAAWTNYWQLLQESERIKERLSLRPGRLAGGTVSTRLL